MAPTISSAKLTLSCPLFAADFDPRNYAFLLVGGGGGEGRSGVGNKISLLNASKRNELSEIVDIELSRDEDSVTSLAAVQASDDSVVALAGINSSVAEQKKGNNQHLRSFRIEYPPRRSESSKEGKQSEKKGKRSNKNNNNKNPGRTTTALSRVSLFRTKGGESQSADTYQRITRLSPWKGQEDAPRVSAITTGLAPSGEIVFFNASSTTPSAADVIGRIRLNSDEEAEDIDIASQDEDGSFPVAYTNGVDVFTCRIAPETRSNAAPEVKCVYKGSTTLPKGPRPKFRALRFLSPTTLLLLQNAPERGGCELILMDIRPPTKSASSSSSSAVILRRQKLRSSIKIGQGLDICNLGTNPENEQQSMIAVSGSDQSIEIFTIEFDPRRQDRTSGGYTKFRSYASLREVHPFSITKICFSNFIPPAHPISPETPPQYVKLASVSMGNTVVVHTFPLAPSPPTSRTPRYVLVMPGESEIWTNFSSAAVALFCILFVIFAVQFFTEIRGLMPPYLGATEWLPPDLRRMVARPYLYPEDVIPIVPLPEVVPTPKTYPSESESEPESESQLSRLLRDTVSPLVRCDPATNEIRVVEQPPSVTDADTDSDSNTDTGADTAINPTTRRWSDLSDADRSAWKHLLSKKGYWTPSDDETILNTLSFGDQCSSTNDDQVED